MKKIFLLIVTIGITLFASAQNIYTSDKNHTRIAFSATHFGISHVDGRFKSFNATLVSPKEDFTDAVIELTADFNSIDTDIEMRDNDLKSESWFDAAKFPTLVFKSISFKKTTDKNYKLIGNITIHDITKPIVLDVLFNGKGANPMTKKSSVGFTINGKLNRNDFKVGTGGRNTVVSNEIDLVCNAEFIIN